MIRHFISTLFSWPNGIVVGNLIASAIWGIPSLWHLHRKMGARMRALERKLLEGD